MVSRPEVLQDILSMMEAPRYLEIGVYNGVTFRSVKAAEKVGVDPRFHFDAEAYRASHPNAALLQQTSDEFFASRQDRFDVVFIDGMHTFDQSLRDFNNALLATPDSGIIVLDDVVPVSHHASLPSMARSRLVGEALGDPDRSWMGDVYRLVFYIASHVQGVSYATVEDSHGMCVVWKEPRNAGQVKRLSVNEISSLPFEETILQRDVYNLRPWSRVRESLRARFP